MGLFDAFKKKRTAAKEPVQTQKAASASKSTAAQTASPENRLRTTLPKDFADTVGAGDVAAIKAVFDRCRIDATSGYAKETALAFAGMPEEAVRWLVAQGADINAKDLYGNTPLHKEAACWQGNTELLVQLGADIEAKNNDGNTPLHRAACKGVAQTVERLLALGADPLARNNEERTPLEQSLRECRNADIVNVAAVADLLVEAGDGTAPAAKRSVESIGKSFEFYRDSFNKDSLEETDAALSHLYELFGVAPAARRRIHDGVSPIAVDAETWQKQHAELWDYLVPAKGRAATAQGEAIRITGKVAYEVLDNGGINWDADFNKMLGALARFFRSGNTLSETEADEADALADALKDGFGEKEPDRLSELAVRWVLANPDPMPLGKQTYRR